MKGPLVLPRGLVGGALSSELPLLRLTLQFAVKGGPLNVSVRGDTQGLGQSI